MCTRAGQKHYMNILARNETRIFVAKKFSTAGNIMFFLFCSSPGWDGVLNQSDIDWVWPVISLLVENMWTALLVHSFPLCQVLHILPLSLQDCQLSKLFTSDKREM